MNTVFVILHVVGAVFVVGPMVVLPMVGMSSLRRGHLDTVASLARMTSGFGLGSIAVAVVGFAIVGTSSADDHFTVNTPWIATSIALYVVAIALTLLLVAPTLKAAGHAGAEKRSPSQHRTIAIGSGATALLFVSIVVLMVWQP